MAGGAFYSLSPPAATDGLTNSRLIEDSRQLNLPLYVFIVAARSPRRAADPGLDIHPGLLWLYLD